MVGCSDQCVFTGAVAVDEAHCRDEVQNTSSARKRFGPGDNALNMTLNSLQVGSDELVPIEINALT